MEKCGNPGYCSGTNIKTLGPNVSDISATNSSLFYDSLHCVNTLTGALGKIIADFLFLITPAFLFLRIYFLAQDIFKFKEDLRIKIQQAPVKVDNLLSFRNEFGILSDRISNFNETHNYIISSSVTVAVVNINAVFYMLFKAKENNDFKHSLWLFTLLPVIIFNYGSLMYGPAMLHDMVSLFETSWTCDETKELQLYIIKT